MLNCLAGESPMIAMGLTSVLELPKSSSLGGRGYGEMGGEKRAQEVVR